MLDEIKQYLKVDYNDEDGYIQSLIIGAKQYIQNTTGLIFTADNTLYLLLIKILVAHWFDNRQAIINGSASEIPYSITNLLTHLTYATETKAEKTLCNDTRRVIS